MTCQGFKSFKNKTKVRFDRGFTAIVGANGSGKSNVIDAFVFVLGELSSKTLRAKNMTDLICNGAKNDKAPSQYAFVEIEFDNSDRQIPVNADTVTVSRKIDREGKGEYRLNEKRTTRTEILELLDLANLKPTSSNVILQGELFRLISMSTLERRQMVDDIAGIATYDEKKKAAQAELETIEQNLSQVSLILNEVSIQLDQLEKERNDALKFLRISKEKDSAENAVLIKKVQDLDEEITRNQERLSNHEITLKKLEEQRSTTQKVLGELDVRLSELKSEIATKESSELAKMSEDIAARKDKITQIQTARKHVKRQRDEAEKRFSNLETESQRIEVERDSLQKDIVSADAEKGSIEQDLNRKGQAHASLLEKVQAKDAEFTAIRNQIQDLKDQIGILNTKKSEITSDLKVLQNNRIQTQKEQQRKKKELEDAERKLESANAELSRINVSQGALDKTGSETSVENLEIHVKSLNARLRGLQATIVKKQEEVMELRSKLKILKKADSGNQAIQEILALRGSKQIGGIYGTIAELGTCNQKYITALEIAGGAGFTYIVVDSQDTAQRCIEYLKENHLGRVTFVPLDKIIPKPLENRLPQSEKIIGRAVDLIDFDPRYRPAFEFVFGRSVIVEDLLTARQLNVPARRVTLEGDVVEGSNLMTGGSIRKGSGMTFSPKEAQMLPTLEEELATLQAKEVDLQDEIKATQAEISTSFKEKINRERASSKVYALISRLEEDIKNCEGAIPELKNAINNLQQEADALSLEMEGLQQKLDALEKEIASLEERRKDCEGKIVSSEEFADRKEVQNLEKQIAALKKTLQNAEISLAKKHTRLEDSLVKRVDELHSEQDEVSKSIQDLGVEFTKLEEEKQTISAELTTLEGTYAAKSQELAQIVAKKNAVIDDITRVKGEMDATTDALHATQMQLNTVHLKLEEVQRERDGVKVQVKPDVAVDPKLLEQAINQLVTLIEQLKAEKAALEPVNMKAIDAFDAAQARFNDLTAKHEKIVVERESILKFMAEIEAEKKRVFMDSFTAINRNFGFIFAKLSPNGEAKLELENEADPFQGGINMLARPGGKKWCLTQAMSGGEKTLTVIALVLGIQLYIPSPYYILDEIDAALDDANAGIVAELVNELANRSQFILITHRDVTMARSHQLLGVTNDDGITQVVNLNLNEVLNQLAKSA